MKKIFFVTLITALSVLSWITTANGQKSSSIDIRVSATVIGTIELVTLRDISFGSVQPGQKEIAISPIIDSGAGKMTANGMPGEEGQASRSGAKGGAGWGFTPGTHPGLPRCTLHQP